MIYFKTFENFNPENIEVGDIVCAKDSKVFDDQCYTVLAVGTFDDVQQSNHDTYWDSTNSDRITVELLDKDKKYWASISNEEGTLTEPLSQLKLVMKKMQSKPLKSFRDIGILESLQEKIEDGDIIHFLPDPTEPDEFNNYYEVIEVSSDVEYLMKKYKDYFWELPENSDAIKLPTNDVKRVLFMREHYKGDWAAVYQLEDSTQHINIEPLYADYPTETNYVPFVIFMKKMDKDKKDKLKSYGILDV